jgi:hypothetical protein
LSAVSFLSVIHFPSLPPSFPLLGNRFLRYHLNNEPAEYGLSAGEFAPGVKAYIGIGVYSKMCLAAGRIQLNPPGLYIAYLTGKAHFENDNYVWYLNKRHHHQYKWVDSQDAETVPHAVDIGAQNSMPSFIGRIVKGNRTYVGFVVPPLKTFYYADENNDSHGTVKGYQVLTCRSSKRDNIIPPPKFDSSIGSPQNSGVVSGCGESSATITFISFLTNLCSLNSSQLDSFL